QGVADGYLPDTQTSTAVAVEDPDPARTLRLKTLLADAAQGTVNDDFFTTEARSQLVPMMRNLLPMYFRPLAPLQSFVLIERGEVQGRQRLRYRAVYGKKPIVWKFEVDGNGKI